MTAEERPKRPKTIALLAIAAVCVLASCLSWKPASDFYSQERMLPTTFSVPATEGLSEEELRQVERKQLTDRLGNAGAYVAIWGAGVCGALGLSLGLFVNGGFVRAAAGLGSGAVIGLIGGGVGGVVGKALSDTFKIAPYHSSMESFGRVYLFQSAAILCFAFAVVVVIALRATLPARRIWMSGAAASGALLSPPAYLAIASLISPLANTDNFIPLDPKSRFAWFIVPTVLVVSFSLFSSRPTPAKTEAQTELV